MAPMSLTALRNQLFKIVDEVIDYMYSELPRPDRHSNQKDQYALSLAVSDKDIHWMDNSMHSFLWINEFKGKVLHGSVPKMGSDVKILYNRMKMRMQRYFLPRLY